MGARTRIDVKMFETRMMVIVGPSVEKKNLESDLIWKKALMTVGKGNVNVTVTNPKKVERNDERDVEERSVKSAVKMTYLMTRLIDVVRIGIASVPTIGMMRDEPEKTLP
jgi:hypothetical protein